MHRTIPWIIIIFSLGIIGVAIYFSYPDIFVVQDQKETEEQFVFPVPKEIPVVPPKEHAVIPPSQVFEGFFESFGNRNRGLLMFRGNPQRNFFGIGPIPQNPTILFRYPENPMCGVSSQYRVEYLWCGTGWTGQPIVWNRDNVQEIIFGGYDGKVHFIDGKTGTPLRKPFPTDDIIKGSGTLDPDGYPLLYFGSRDNKLRILALDQGDPVELWNLDATHLGGIWNNDWDSNPVIRNDILYEGGENGWFYAIQLNRGYENGSVTVDPEIVFKIPGYNDELLAKVGNNVSIENSVVFFRNRMYFANSGGRVLGLDVSRIKNGVAPVVFDYWVGDDVDATIVIDDQGMLYVASELERGTERSYEIGQLIKLNPYTKDNPLVWGLPIPKQFGLDGGTWSTPVLQGNYLYASVNPGELWVVDKQTGEKLWSERTMKRPHYALPSPVIVDNQLLLATCEGKLRNYSLENPTSPRLLWELPVGNKGECIESTPAVWNGMIWIGSRDGYFYGIGEKNIE